MIGEHAILNIRPADLPAPPQAAVQIMRACATNEVDLIELSKLASTDPVMTAELLRVVNSSYFGLSREVQSIQRAVTVLGQRTVRNIALCISVRDALNTDAIPGFDASPFWEDSIRRAVSARLLAEQLKIDPDDCFTCGLLQDFGLLVMFFLEPSLAGEWHELRRQDPDRRYGSELGSFGTTHDKVGMMLATSWQLPDELASALGSHHECPSIAEQKDALQICRVLHCADWMTAIFSADNKAHAITRCRRLLKDEFDFDDEQIEALLSTIPPLVKAAAEALGLGVPQQPDFADLLREANVHLAEANLSYQELTWRLEQTLKERDEIQAELDKELNLAREIQKSMLPRPGNTEHPISGMNYSARQLSGDFYDYFLLPDGRYYFNLGDVSGKGVNAALFMAKTSSLFRCLGKRILDPSELFAQINNELCESSTRGMFVTLCGGIYDPIQDTALVVNAGHMPAVLVSKEGQFGQLQALGPPLGIIPDTEFPAKPIHLKGGSLYLFSDGVTEGTIENGKMLGFKGLLHLLASVNSQSRQQRLEKVVERLTLESAPLHDDMTMLAIQKNCN